MAPSKERLLSLDVLRGITIAAMILVNNPGSWDYIYAPLRHSEWNGITPTDLIFPFFMFIMGISTYISLHKSNFACSKHNLAKIAKRTMLIFLIGIGLALLNMVAQWSWPLPLENLRILGVLQRLAISYGFAALIAITISHRYIPWIIATTLVGYAAILLLGHGFTTDSTNILAVVDQRVLGLNHMFVEFGLDPEGILSTIPSIAHVLVGLLCGRMLFMAKNNSEKVTQLLILGAVLFIAGELLSYGCPINKKVWSPTFVMVTCGLASTILALLMWVIDVKHHKKWSTPFEAFGANPLMLYVLAGVISTFMSMNLCNNTMSPGTYLYQCILQTIFGDYMASLIFALLLVAVCWIAGWMLLRRKIYIKI